MDGYVPFFSIALVVVLTATAAAGHGALQSEVYWQAVLPNTPMPNAIRDRLQSDLIDEKAGTTVDVGKGGVHVDTGKPKGGTTVDVDKGGVHVNVGKGKQKGGATVNTGHGNTHVTVGKGGVNVDTGKKGKKSVIVNVGRGKSPFLYNYYATAEELKNNQNAALFFLEKQLHPGAKMNIFFPKATPGPNFLPRTTANAIPFSSNKLPEVLQHYSIEPTSQEAKLIEETIKECEQPSIKGETKYCATSMESMIDYATSKLGTHVRVLETKVDKESPRQAYTITQGVHKVVSAKSVACHDEAYIYAVYYCHETSDTSAYTVPMVGKNGTRVDAVVICHKDTSRWNPKHIAFQVLKVKPGSVPICHFIPQDHIIWVQN